MSNSSSILAYSLTTLVGLGGILQGAEEDTAALTRRIERLEKQNAALKASYVQARSDADKAAAQLVDIRTRLEALGGAALGNSEERLIQAVADIEASNDRIQRLEQASVKLSGAILAYMKQAISEDANARTAVESSLRLLESVLGYRQQPVRDGAGTLAEAKVLSIDSESGVVVLCARMMALRSFFRRKISSFRSKGAMREKMGGSPRQVKHHVPCRAHLLTGGGKCGTVWRIIRLCFHF